MTRVGVSSRQGHGSVFFYSRSRIVFVLAAIAAAACTPGAGTRAPGPLTESTQATPEASAAAFLEAYRFPASIDPNLRYLFYLHGKIVEDQGLPAIDPVYGEYQYAAILRALAGGGFVVVSEQRSKDADANAYAERLVAQVNQLLQAQVPAGHITVVGASKGGWIAATVSSLMKNPALNYVMLGICPPEMIDYWKAKRMGLSGNVLTIYDSGDPYSGSCEELFQMSAGNELGRHNEIVLHLGLGHGILYKPLAEWVAPTTAWAGQ